MKLKLIRKNNLYQINHTCSCGYVMKMSKQTIWTYLIVLCPECKKETPITQEHYQLLDNSNEDFSELNQHYHMR